MRSSGRHQAPQAVLNLLSNAAKFTHNGEITLAGRGASSGDAATDRDRRRRHWRRHQPGSAQSALQQIHPGQRPHRLQVWRHRSWPVAQPEPLPAYGRRDHGPEPARQGSCFTHQSTGCRRGAQRAVAVVGRGRRARCDGAKRGLGAQGRVCRHLGRTRATNSKAVGAAC